MPDNSWEENRKAILLQLGVLNTKVDTLDEKLDTLSLNLVILETKHKMFGAIYGAIGGALVSSIVSFIIMKIMT